jgi:hypothetical protein
MKFNELSDGDIEYIKEVHASSDVSWDEKMSTLMGFLDKSERTVRKWLVKLDIKNKQVEDSPQFKVAKKKRINKKNKRLLITWAQNNTPVHEPFLKNMEAYAEEIGARIYVVAGRYKNPTSVFTDKDHESWHSRVQPYLYANREKVHKHLVIVGDVKVVPTAVNPMVSMEGFSGQESCIFGHPKTQSKTVPVLEGRPPKKMQTTGSCTVPNYTDSKAGKKGEFHHTLGFVIVEVKNGNIHFSRQVTATDDGNFNDLYYNVEFNSEEEFDPNTIYKDGMEGKTKISRINEVDALIAGDIHFGEQDQRILDVTLDVLMKKLYPKTVVLHDVFNGHSISHHDRKDPFAQYIKEKEGKNDLEKEIQELLEGLKPFEKYKTVIVRSNHDDFLDRWLKDVDWKKGGSIKNSICYMKYAQLLLEEKAPKGVIPYLINERYPNMITLGRDDSYRVHDWEVGQHGDIGASGSRGSATQFRRLNTKMIVAHSHAPLRQDGVVQVGTSTLLRVGYNKGPSAWMHSHAIVHKDGKAQQIDFVEGMFTTFE